VKANGGYRDANHSDASAAALSSSGLIGSSSGPVSTDYVPDVIASSGYGFVDQVCAEVGPTVRSYGFEIVEIDAVRLSRRSSVRVVVYRAAGMTADDCAELAKAIRYRLALVPGAEDAALEVSSPGTTRKIKSPHEYEIFCGCSVEILIGDCWIRGVIITVDEGIVTLGTGLEERKIEIEQIRKGRLSDEMNNGQACENLDVK